MRPGRDRADPPDGRLARPIREPALRSRTAPNTPHLEPVPSHPSKREVMAKLEIIVASTRPNRIGPSIGQWALAEAKEHGAFTEVELVDLAEVNLPFMNEPHHPRLGHYVHQHTQEWSA